MTSKVVVYSEKGAEYESLIPLDGKSKRASVSNEKYIFYKFSDVQRLLIKNTFSDEETVAVTLRFTVKFPSNVQKEFEAGESLPVKIGFLTDEDFLSKGKLSFNEKLSRPVVTCDMKSAFNPEKRTQTFDVSLALPFDKYSKVLQEKAGLFIQSSIPCFLYSCRIGQAVTGYDRSREIPFYGFSSNGGNVNFDQTGFDFTGSSNIFPVAISKENVPPSFIIKINQSETKDEKLLDVKFTFGGERLWIYRSQEIILSSLALKNPFANMEVLEGSENVLSCLMISGDKSLSTGNNQVKNSNKDYVVTPIKTDPGLILEWPINNWRNSDYELFTWDRLDNILFFDTKNYAVQSRFFGRMAFFTEKEGFKGKLLTNEELKGKHDFNAHDYSGESLARFFNKAFRSNFHLNEEEEVLLDILVSNGILQRTEDDLNPYVSNGGAVLSVSREIPSYNRKSLLAHEGWHTIFFTDEDFRNYVSVVYNVMDPQTMTFLHDYFRSQSSLGYDLNDEYLMHNEFMAYILQNTPGNAGSYFMNKATWPSVKKVTPVLCDYIINTKGSGFDDCQSMLQDYLFDKYNLVSGNIGLCSY